jgi:uncharacterized protein (TIGR02421 family)
MRSRAQLELDARLREVSEAATRLPSLVARGGREERARLVEAHRLGRRFVPSWSTPADPVAPAARHALAHARRLAGDGTLGASYRARLDELELELDLRDALGSPRTVRALARRRWPTGASRPFASKSGPTLREVADALLDEVAPEEDERPSVPASGPGSLQERMLALASRAGLTIKVSIEPGLVARAAAGERTVFLADTRFGEREARRLAVHEVLGHLVAAANARSQPLALLSVGTAGAFEDQEGLALCLEELAGLLDARRVRTFAARVLATDAVHEGADPNDVVALLVGERGLGVDDAIAITERSFRGGGLTRDASYLFGWMRVRRALRRADTTIDELRWGKVGLDALPALRALHEAGALREPGPHRPSLASNLDATGPGTSSFTSPPSVAASLMRFEET